MRDYMPMTLAQLEVLRPCIKRLFCSPDFTYGIENTALSDSEFSQNLTLLFRSSGWVHWTKYGTNNLQQRDLLHWKTSQDQLLNAIRTCALTAIKTSNQEAVRLLIPNAAWLIPWTFKSTKPSRNASHATFAELLLTWLMAVIARTLVTYSTEKLKIFHDKWQLLKKNEGRKSEAQKTKRNPISRKTRLTMLDIAHAEAV